MFAKHFINLIYFVQVLGWNKIFSYMKHEFFTIRNCRSFVGGHFSNRTPSFLLVALRVWLGSVWIFEGVMKIVEGWCKTPHLKAYFGMADSWYDKIINPSTASSIADATSSATTAVAATTTPDAVAKVGHVILNLDIFGLVKIIFVSGKDLASSSLGDYAFKIDIPSMNWILNHVVLASDGLQMFMQIFIVVAEILVGLALIGGLFTSPAAGFSLILQFMFITTTGIYLGTAWMMFAGIAMLIGAGRSFGFDYYVMPALKKQWKRLPFVRKLYIYND